MKASTGFLILTSTFSGIACLAMAPSAGATSIFSGPSTQLPMSHYATQRSQLVSTSRKAIAEDDDLVVAVDDFTYTALIKASATNAFAPPATRPPVKKKTVSRAPVVAKKK